MEGRSSVRFSCKVVSLDPSVLVGPVPQVSVLLT